MSSLAAWLALGAGASLLGAGCSQEHMEKLGDPLLGSAPPNMQQVPTPQAGDKHNTTSSLVPPVPVNTPFTTNATQAAQTPPGNSLMINTWQRTVDPPVVPASNGMKPAVVVPVPNADKSASAVPSASGQWSSGVTPVSATAVPPEVELRKRLQSHGTIREWVVPDGVRVVCAVNGQIYDVTGRDFAAAAQAILQQIEQGR